MDNRMERLRTMFEARMAALLKKGPGAGSSLEDIKLMVERSRNGDDYESDVIGSAWMGYKMAISDMPALLKAGAKP